MSRRMARRTAFPAFCLLASATGLLLLSACGGSSGGLTTSTPPTTQATPPPPRVVIQGSYALAADFVSGSYFTTERAGTIVATVDYTFATSQIFVWIASGQCTFDQFVADQCTYASQSLGGAKPRSLSVPGAPAGTYTLIVANLGPDDEAISFQVVFTPSAASTSDEATLVRPVQPGGSFLGRLPHR